MVCFKSALIFAWRCLARHLAYSISSGCETEIIFDVRLIYLPFLNSYVRFKEIPVLLRGRRTGRRQSVWKSQVPGGNVFDLVNKALLQVQYILSSYPELSIIVKRGTWTGRQAGDNMETEGKMQAVDCRVFNCILLPYSYYQELRL